jgi:hypothetical protein
MKKKSFVKWLDRLWGMVIHNRDVGCQWCRKNDGSKLDAHHIFSRTNRSTRWDTKNGILLCYYCHNFRIGKDHEGLRSRVIVKLGYKEYKKLYKRSQELATAIDYEYWEKLLLKELESLRVAIPKRPKNLPKLEADTE